MPATKKQPLRIGFVVLSLGGGGAEAVTIHWAETLAARGHRVHIFTCRDDPHAATEVRGVDVKQFPGRSRFARAFALPIWIRRQAQTERLDVLVTILTFSNLAGLLGVSVLRPLDLSLFISEHNIATLAVPFSRPGFAATAKRFLARRLYKLADGAIGVSHPVAVDLISGFGVSPERVFALPNPITDLPSPEARLSRSEVTVAFVGRLAPQKDPLLFVDTLAALSRQGFDVHGLVIGDGPLKSATMDRGRERAVRLSFLGWKTPWWTVDPLPDCLLLTSSIEGLANVLVEAAAADIPVVARSDALGTADAVVPGMTGELSLGHDPERLAKTVIRAIALRDDRRDPAQSWLAHFSYERSTDLLLEAIEIVRDIR